MVSKLTDLELNAIIAKEQGWKDIYRCGQSLKRTENGEREGKLLCGTKDEPSINYGREYEAIPNYCKDLNSMHQVEKSLPHEMICNYMIALSLIKRHEPSQKGELQTYIFHATARERAEAYVSIIKNNK